MNGDTPDAVYWASAFAMWAVTIGAGAYLLHCVLRYRAAIAHAEERAAERSDLQKWASWTMLSVTDHDGMLYAQTLTQMFAQGITERVWEDPMAVAIWHADSTLYGDWQQEAERLLQSAQDDPETPGA